jgi:uncharacterized protein (TIGR04141 family)
MGMPKSRDFSIYLLKAQFSVENALKDDHGLELVTEENTNLPDGSSMYLSDRPGNPPWWKSYWGINKNLHQVQKGAIVFLPVNDRWIVLTFGLTHHCLKDNSYEYDFGLKTTLNALDPKKIKSTDILQPENARRQRIQSPTAASLTFFDVRYDESIIKRLAGAVKQEYAELFKNVAGANSLKISSKLPPDQIIELCTTLIEIYQKDDYVQSFPDIQHIVPIRDPEKKTFLDQKLLEAFANEPMELVLSIPEIIDYSTSFTIKYFGAGKSNREFNDVFISGYREYLQERGVGVIDQIKTFQSHRLRVINENGDTLREYRIYDSFLFDCEIEGATYHLCDGEWYFIETNYVQKLSDQLDLLCIDQHSFLSTCNVVREDQYNTLISQSSEGVFCLDKQNIAPAGQRQVEPCDIVSDGKQGLLSPC